MSPSQEVTKVRPLGNSIIFANTGAVGMSQMMSEKLRADWENKVFRNIGTPEECMRKIGADISGLIGPFLQSATYVRSLGESVLSSLCKCLVGVSGPTQLAVLARTAGQSPIVTMVTQSAIDEHMQQVVAAEKSLVDEIRGRGAGAAAVPQERPPVVESSEGSR